MKAADLAFHEFTANYLFDDYDLQPFFACDSRVKDGDGSQAGAFEIGNERWVVKLYYQDSGVVHPGDDGNGNIRTGAENPIRDAVPYRGNARIPVLSGPTPRRRPGWRAGL